MVLWIVTVKYPKSKKHDPKCKIVSHCFTSDLCTDSSGSHHCFLVRTSTEHIKDCEDIIHKHFGDIHVTRIELSEVYE